MVTVVNSKAEVLKAASALAVNCNAAKGLMDIMKTNLGPRGTLKMLVGGAGQIKITKDGCVLLKEMQIQHPTASMIARAATAQDDITGDGTTSTVLFMGELMRQAERLLQEGVHPRHITEGIDAARQECLNFLESCKLSPAQDRELHMSVARTSLNTKLHHVLAEQVSGIVVDAVNTIRKEGEPIDLHMVEIMHMRHKMATDTQLIRGLVMDHGTRHDGMPKRLENCYILTCNVSLKYEKSEVNSGFFYSSADQRDKLVESERKFTDEKVKQIIELKNQVCTEENKKNFVILNMKGIDPPSLDMLAKAGIMALRRVKRRNMERLTLACGGVAVNSCDDLSEEDLGFAGLVYEQPIGEEKYTFVENVKHPLSCTILIKSTYEHSIAQVKDAVRDGLRAVLGVIEDSCVVPGAGAFEIGAYVHLDAFKKQLSGKPRLGVEAFAKALLIIPSTLAENSGLDAQDMLLKLIEQQEKQKELVGLDITGGEVIDPGLSGIWDSYRSKKQIFNISPTLAQQLLLCDEIIRAGKQMKKD